MKTGKPIFYTSADSVFQIAFMKKLSVWINSTNCAKSPVKADQRRLQYRSCYRSSVYRRQAGNFQRTGNRHDLAVEPPARPCCRNWLMKNTARWFLSVKCGHLRQLRYHQKSESDWPGRLFDATIKEMKEAGDNTIVFTTSLTSTLPGATVATSPVMLGSGTVRPPSAGADVSAAR